MKINLLSCFAQRPDRRAISKCLVEISHNTNEALSEELTDILLEGDAVEIEIGDKSSGSALRALRKLSVEYEFIAKTITYIFPLLLLASCTKLTNTSSIKVVGKMSDVMWKGDLKAKIATDSLNNKATYGLGPIEFLKGEIVLFEGQTFVSKVVDSISHKVSKSPSASAPFFVYTTNSNLKAVNLPSTYYALHSIENYIDSVYKNYDQPLLIRIDGVFSKMKLHSVNLPEGEQVTSPDEAHQGLTQYDFKNISGSLIGFFSRNHKAVFTHHDSFFHAHFISDDRQVLGHIDELDFNASKVRLKVSE